MSVYLPQKRGACASGSHPCRAAPAISSGAKPQSARASSVCSPGAGGGRGDAPGVRLNRGAGAGWTTPPTSVKVPRSRRCGCVRRLAGVEHRGEAGVGALQQRAPLVARSSSSSAAATRAFIAGHDARSSASGTGPPPSTSSASPVRRSSSARDPRVDRPERDVADRRRSRRPRRTRRRCRGGSCPRSPHCPAARRPCIIPASRAAPSTIAASTTWPRPDRAASTIPHTIPNASSMPPPPKSPTSVSGGTGGSPARPIIDKRAGQGDVVDVAAGGLRVRSVLAPAGHPAVDERTAGGPGTRPARGPAAR